jgi:hypothetical protein
MKPAIAFALLLAASPSLARETPSGEWAHVGNTVNSAIFVDRAVLGRSGAARPFRTLHINVQTAMGWRAAEHRGTIDCAARTLTYEGVVVTKTDGSRDTLASAVGKPVPFPKRGALHAFATSVCAGKLGPAVADPAAWTNKNFRPG